MIRCDAGVLAGVLHFAGQNVQRDNTILGGHVVLRFRQFTTVLEPSDGRPWFALATAKQLDADAHLDDTGTEHKGEEWCSVAWFVKLVWVKRNWVSSM